MAEALWGFTGVVVGSLITGLFQLMVYLQTREAGYRETLASEYARLFVAADASLIAAMSVAIMAAETESGDMSEQQMEALNQKRIESHTAMSRIALVDRSDERLKLVEKLVNVSAPKPPQPKEAKGKIVGDEIEPIWTECQQIQNELLNSLRSEIVRNRVPWR